MATNGRTHPKCGRVDGYGEFVPFRGSLAGCWWAGYDACAEGRGVEDHGYVTPGNHGGTWGYQILRAWQLGWKTRARESQR